MTKSWLFSSYASDQLANIRGNWRAAFIIHSSSIRNLAQIESLSCWVDGELFRCLDAGGLGKRNLKTPILHCGYTDTHYFYCAKGR